MHFNVSLTTQREEKEEKKKKRKERKEKWSEIERQSG